jgi:hypothetical protein
MNRESDFVFSKGKNIKDQKLKFYLLYWIIFLLLTSCNEKEKLNYVNQYGANSPEVKEVMRGKPLHRVIDAIVSGPTYRYKNCEYLNEHFAEASAPGDRPLRGASIVKYLDENYPKNCGYSFPDWKGAYSRAFKPNVFAVLAGKKPNCHVSNCSTASYLALVEAIRGTEHEKKLQGKFKMGGPLYAKFVYEGNMIENVFGPGEFNLGSFEKINRMDEATITDFEARGWPSPGDFLILNRRNGSGHSVVFSHYQGTGNTREVCYWSSNRGTKGMGVQCEQTRKMGSIHAGRVEG